MPGVIHDPHPDPNNLPHRTEPAPVEPATLPPWPGPDDKSAGDRDGLALIRAEAWALGAERGLRLIAEKLDGDGPHASLSDAVNFQQACATLANAWAMIAIAHQDPVR